MFTELSRRAIDHAPVILSGIAIAGTISATVLAVQATPKAMRMLELQEEDRILNKWEVVKVVWPCYVPALTTVGMTIAAIVGAQSINQRRQAALLGVYALSEKTLSEYKSKVTEVLGEKKEKDLRSDIAKDRLEANPVENKTVVLTGKGDHLCYDVSSGRYFKSDYEDIRKAVNDINTMAITSDYASLNDFYRLIGLNTVALGEELGWRGDHILEVEYDSHMTSDNVPCMSINFQTEPIRGYWKGFGV